MTRRQAVFFGQVRPQAVKDLPHRRWDIRDDRGSVFRSLPFLFAYGRSPIGSAVTVSPSPGLWNNLSQTERDLVDSIEICLLTAGLTPSEEVACGIEAVVAEKRFRVAESSPWQCLVLPLPALSEPLSTPPSARKSGKKKRAPSSSELVPVEIARRRFEVD